MAIFKILKASALNKKKHWLFNIKILNYGEILILAPTGKVQKNLKKIIPKNIFPRHV